MWQERFENGGAQEGEFPLWPRSQGNPHGRTQGIPGRHRVVTFGRDLRCLDGWRALSLKGGILPAWQEGEHSRFGAKSGKRCRRFPDDGGWSGRACCLLFCPIEGRCTPCAGTQRGLAVAVGAGAWMRAFRPTNCPRGIGASSGEAGDFTITGSKKPARIIPGRLQSAAGGLGYVAKLSPWGPFPNP